MRLRWKNPRPHFAPNVGDVRLNHERVEIKPHCELCSGMRSLRSVEVNGSSLRLCWGCRQSLPSQLAPINHGTYSGYRGGCDCGPCTSAYSDYQKRYRIKQEVSA